MSEHTLGQGFKDGGLTATEVIAKARYAGEPLPQSPQEDQSAKQDDGKVQFDLPPARACLELARVYTYGAKKYAAHRWRTNPMRWGRAYAALLRHLNDFWAGENRDPESGLYHMAQAAFWCFTLLYYTIFSLGEDDRPITKIEVDSK